jgi:hypothetical protein
VNAMTTSNRRPARPWPILLAGILALAACGTGSLAPTASLPSPARSTAAPSGATPWPTAPPIPPSPSAGPIGSTPGPLGPTPGPTARPSGPPSELLIRLTACADLCVDQAGTVILPDGTMIWGTATGRVVEAQLTPDALARVHSKIDGLAALQQPGSYRAALKPDAVPVPRGIVEYTFELTSPAGVRYRVTSGDPHDFTTEPDLWTIPPEMSALAALARKLEDPVAWLGVDSIGPRTAYVPPAYRVLTELYDAVGPVPELAVDVDDVGWPLPGPIDLVGAPVAQPDTGVATRCLMLDPATARQMATAETVAFQVVGIDQGRDIRLWSSALTYRWDRGGGLVVVTLSQLLPYEDDACRAGLLQPDAASP